MNASPYDPGLLAARAKEIVANTRELSALGWTPATSSNFSMRLEGRLVAITVSGRDKGKLDESDIMVVDWDGKAVGSQHRPSAETGLHTQLYRRFPEVNVVLHTHSRVQTVASRLFAPQGYVRLQGYELQKAFSGNSTHEDMLEIPVLPNSQDIPALVARVERLTYARSLWGYLIDGHGIYAWGRDMPEARRHLEAFEFLLDCELDLRRMRA
ncbi:MAG: methylthioribulose 1-phosphate dehydratase [Chiayiivirga sp.]|jgi:methylthioribulose-1-phosphate dehydratase|uniref:methylthioribulose 1-phosphate dehydratase n=1 Tax=Chiayiivirga sp. TaxID=2041042 RepID=UPI0025B9910E|nr:methylthioribulose 1-phosphate dehydratase [Chiayiivirga sp.]MCI1709452.1 methylthioribulose 1-phosphate dehydratase [Chiayiivirga sp.]MCI1730260.1 methylthioribulose 1-phosphate dehydratase [Chiayiivirga sp.]